MTTFYKEQHLPYTPEQLYNLVIDVESYATFLPWIESSKVSDHQENSFLGDLKISYKGLSQTYTSKVHGQPHEFIQAQSLNGPFKSLTSTWKFKKTPTGTMVHFELSYELKSNLLALVIRPIFKEMSLKIIDAFAKRAQSIY